MIQRRTGPKRYTVPINKTGASLRSDGRACNSIDQDGSLLPLPIVQIVRQLECSFYRNGASRAFREVECTPKCVGDASREYDGTCRARGDGCLDSRDVIGTSVLSTSNGAGSSSSNGRFRRGGGDTLEQ